MKLPFTPFNWLKRRPVENLEPVTPAALPSAVAPPVAGTDSLPLTAGISSTAAGAPASEELRWIENDGLLRDEGVLFGMSGGDIAAKLAVIDFYYARQIQQAVRECDLAQERLTAARTAIAEHTAETKDRRREWEELQSKLPLTPHDFFRSLIGMVVYGGMIALVYFVLYHWLKRYWPQHTGLVVAGIYVFGMLSMFQRGSFFYAASKPAGAEDGESAPRPEAWKVLLEEVGVPAVTALLATVWGWNDHPASHGVAMFLFLFFAFLFPGKGFLNNIVRVAASLRLVQANRLVRQWRRRRLAELAAALTADQHKLASLTAEAEQLEASRDLLPDAEQLRLLSRAKQELFSSEYTLAKESRKTLTLDEVLHVRANQDN